LMKTHLDQATNAARRLLPSPSNIEDYMSLAFVVADKSGL
jgi:hypothetical protein